VNVSLDGDALVSGATVNDTLQTYDGGGGQLLVSGVTSGTHLALSGGTIAGTIAARDNGLASLSTGINALASQLISQVNSVYQTGYDLNGHKGASFFSGANAGDISVTASLVNDPSTLQASGVAGAAGNNQVALALAQLANAPQAGLANQTFSQSYNHTATDLGSALATVNSQLSDQQTVQTMLQNQRSSVSGVSLDEEMTHMVSYEKAYQASAELVTTLDQMLTTVIGMKQLP
jgi:flagellar hook-associated protein 1